MTTTKLLPPHGSEARYQGTTTRPGCRCRTCIDGWTLAGKRRHLARLQGKPASIPSEPVTHHLTRLYAANMTTGQIAAASGVDVSTIRDHAKGKFPRIRRTTANKILAVRPGGHPAIGFVPALGSIRRCRALYAHGHGAQDIAAAHPQLQTRTVDHIIRGDRQHVAAFVQAAVTDAYRLLSAAPGTSTQAKSRAAREGWLGPAYWDDDEFDNPAFDPAATLRALNFHERAKLRREEIIHLAWHGDTPEQILDRLNGEVSISTVRQIVQEWRTGQKRQRTPERTAA